MANNNAMGAMLNAYPDSVGGTLGDIVSVLGRPEFQGAFTSFYILPSIFNTDLDRGFSLIDYGLNHLLAAPKDLENLKSLNIDLALDFILNHASVLSKEFQDILKAYPDFIYPHRSYAVNMNYIQYVTKSDIILTDGQKIPLSRNNYTKISEQFLNFAYTNSFGK